MRSLLLATVVATTACAEGDQTRSSFTGPPTSGSATTASASSTTASGTAGTDATGAGSSSGGVTGSSSTTSEGSTGGGPGSTAGATTAGGTTAGGTTTTAGSSGTTGDQPPTGPWAQCTMANPSCEAGLQCLGPTVGDEGYCAGTCAPAGDPGSCGASPGGTASVTCISVQGTSICALDCSGGKTCPGGMVCTMDTDDVGAIEICF